MSCLAMSKDTLAWNWNLTEQVTHNVKGPIMKQHIWVTPMAWCYITTLPRRTNIAFPFKKSYWVLLSSYLTTVASMFFTSICYRTGARFAKYAQWARHKLSRIQCSHTVHSTLALEGACFECGCWEGPLTADTLKQSPTAVSVADGESASPRSLFCLCYSFQCRHNPSFKKRNERKKKEKNKNTQTAAASNFRSSGTCGAWTWTRT